MTTTRTRYEVVMGCELRAGDRILVAGYEWVIDRVFLDTFDPRGDGHVTRRYACRCHWSGNGDRPPEGYRQDFSTARRLGMPWTRVAARQRSPR